MNSRHSIYTFLIDLNEDWGDRFIIPASGVSASGWTKDNKVFLYSPDGYSITNPKTREMEIRNYDEDNLAVEYFSEDNLEFKIPELKETIKIFGIWGGDGSYQTEDSWSLDSFTPGLGEQIIGIKKFEIGSNKKSYGGTEYHKNFQLISLKRLEYSELKFGFSPDQNLFGIFGSAGAEIFFRK